MRVGIISAGAWGTALAKTLVENGHDVAIWDHMKHVVHDIAQNHRNDRFLMGVKLPDGLHASIDITDVAQNRDFIILATPTLYIKNVLYDIASLPDVRAGIPVCVVISKGFISHGDDLYLLADGVETVLPSVYKGMVVYVSGPSHAEEVARGKLTGLIAACNSGTNAIKVRELLSGGSLLVFSSLDRVGVQVCGAVKNVIAISFGMLDAFMEFTDYFGDNRESLLLAAGLNEIQLLGTTMGATHPETFTSIAGVGDLDVTCRSRHGRNRRFGREIIIDRILERFKDIEDIIEHIDYIGYLPEGIVAAKYVYMLMKRANVRLPICETVYRISNRSVEPADGLSDIVAQLGKNAGLGNLQL